jgi:hypothetical protein
MLLEVQNLCKKTKLLLLASMGLFVVIAGVVSNNHPAAAATGINAQMNFQGRLLNAQGATVPDGFYNVQFKIYQDGDGQSVGDTTGSPAGTLKWTETYLNNNSQGVLVKNGFLSVQLGSITSLSSINFNQDTLWLSMNIAGTNATCASFAACSPDGEMTPMKRLSANAYAINSQQLGGLSSSQFLQLGQGAQTDASTNSSIFVNKTSTGNLLQLQNGGVDAFTINNSGDIAFGAANHTLSVATAGAATAGFNLSVTAGAAGSGGTALKGGTLTLQGGTGGGTNGNGGDVAIDGGVKNGTGTNGVVNIGGTNASAVNISRTGVATTINGSLTVNQASTLNGNTAVTGTFSASSTVTASNGLTQTTGALNLTATSGALAVSGLGASSISTGTNALTVTSSNFNTTATGINSTAIGATTASTGAFTTVTASGTIVGSSTVQGTQLISTVASGTAPLVVASNTKVISLNADLLDGLDSTAFLQTESDTLATVTARGATTSTASSFNGGLTAGNGFVLTTGALNLTSTSGAIALAGLSASSISTGANALTITSSNFNTTATGINGTAIGATTAAAGTFTGITTPTIASTAGLGITGGTTITISSTGANTASFDSGTTGAVNIGTGANAKVVTVGSINSTSSTIIQSGSTGISLNGNTTLTGTLSVSSTINAVSGYKFNGTAGATTTCNSGQYLQQQVVQGGITTGGTCTTVSPTTTLQQAYDNSGASPIITLTSTGHGLFLRDASSTVGGNLFAVQSNGGTTSYLAVTTSGASVAGTFSTTGTITASNGGVGNTTIVPSLILGTASSADGTLAFKNHTDTNTITLNSISASSSYTLTLPTTAPAGGLCIETSTGNAQQLVFASCANNNTSIQQVNAWDSNNTNTLVISPSTVGNEIVLTTQIPTSGVTVTGVSGGGVASWNKVVTSAGNGTVNRVEMWVGTVTASGSSTITVTYSAAPGAEEITATEFTAAGVNAATSWGTESFGSQLNSTASSTITFPSRTAVNGSELYVGYAQVQNPPATAGSTSGFNYRITSTQHNVITYNTSLAANTTYQPTANQNTSGQSNAVAVVLTAFVTSTSINNTTSLQNANFYVQAASAGSVAGVLQAASSGTADILNLRNSGGTNVLSVSSVGNVLVKPAASTTAFQVQNASGAGVLTVDTSNSKVVLGTSGSLGGALTFADAGDSNTITLAAPLTVAATYTLLLPSNSPTAGLCLATSPSNANQLVFSSCATQVSAASISYVGRWGNTGTSVTTIADSPSSKGNLIVFYSHTVNNVSITGISGGGVTNWTKVTGNANTTGQGNNEMWRGVVATAGSATITVTYSGAAGTNDIEAQEFTMGSSTGTWAIDTSGTAISPSNGTTINYPNLTPLNSSELYTGYAWGGGTMSAGSTSGFTYQNTTANKYLAFNSSVTGGVSYQPTASQSTSAAWNSIGAVIAAYTGTSVIVNSTAVQQANFDVQAAQAGTVAGVLQAASSGTADILQLQDALGNNVVSVNALNGLSLGTSGVASGQLNFTSKNGNQINLFAPDSLGSTYQLTLPTTTPAPGQCLATSPSNANQLVFSSCANQVTSIAISNVNSWKSSTVSLTATLAVSPANLGDLMTLAIFASKGNTITSVSGGGVSAWSRIIGANSEELWRGVVTSTGASTITVTVSTPSGPTVELAAQEWTTGSATGSWVIDTSGTISNPSSTTVTYPSLTPQSTKDLYIGYAIGGSTMSAGSTSGFTYLTGGSASNQGTYNTTTSTTVQPTATQSSSNTSIAVAALIAAYSSSSVISNSTNTQQANFNIQAATPGSVAGTLQAFFTGTGDIFDLLDGNGTLVGSTGNTGNLLVKPSTASASAFQVQTTGGTNVLSADTNSKLVVIGAGSAGEATPSLLVLDNETGTSADPTVMNGAMYYNATTHDFRCGVAGAWQNCTGLLYSNTSNSSSNSNCSNNCAAFTTAASLPANYCQPGRVVKLLAAGYFSSVATPSNLQFGVYYGTDSSVAANDTLLGTLPPTASVTSASNNYFQMNFNIICFSTSSMQSNGILNIQTGASNAGMTALPMNSTSGTSVSSNTAKNLYVFPIWDTASSSNTATMTQFTVNGS